MTRSFVYSEEFDKKWQKLNLTDNDLAEFEEYLLKNPTIGKVIQGTGGLRKVRWALPSTGKSGGIRVLYIDVVVREKIYAIDLFTKGEKDDLTDFEKKKLKQLTAKLKSKGAEQNE